MNLKNMKVSLFEITYKKKLTFSRHSNLLRCTCIGIEEVFGSHRRGNINKGLLKREAFWIHKLKSLMPNGMNEELELSVFL